VSGERSRALWALLLNYIINTCTSSSSERRTSYDPERFTYGAFTWETFDCCICFGDSFDRTISKIRNYIDFMCFDTYYMSLTNGPCSDPALTYRPIKKV